MALDRQTLNKINSAIKTLVNTGSSIDKKGRELMTLLYAMSQGFIDVNQKMSDLLEDVTSGQFEKTNLRGHLEYLGVAEDKIGDILDMRKEIDKIDEKRIVNAKDYFELLELIYNADEDRYNLSKDLLTTFDQINSKISDHERLIRSTGTSMESQSDHLYRQLKAHGELKNAFKAEIGLANDLNAQLSTVNDFVENSTSQQFVIEGVGRVDTAGAIDAISQISAEQLKSVELEDKLRRQKLRAFVAYAQKSYTLDIETGDLNSTETGLKLTGAAAEAANQSIDSVADSYELLVDQIASGNALTQVQIDNLTNMEYAIIKQAAEAKELSNVWREGLGISKENLKVLSKFSPEILAASAASDQFVGSLRELATILPQGLRNVLGIDEGINRIERAGQDALSKFKHRLAETGNLTSAMNAGFGTWKKGIQGAISPLGAAALIVGGLVVAAKGLASEYDSIAHSAHISTLQAKELYRSNLDLIIAQKNQFLNAEEILAVQEAYVHATGQVFSLTEKGGQKLALQLAEISKAFGYNAEQAVEMYEVFSQMGADKALANKLQTELGFMSEMAGLSPELVGKDLIASAETLAIHFGGMPEEAAKAVLEVNRLGMSMKRAGDLANRMLDLEGFMTDMFELAAMGGPDLSGAFDLRLRGADLSEVIEASLNAIGSLSEFNAQDEFTKRKLASTMGMSVDELSKTLMLREKLMGMSKAEQALVNSNVDQFGNIADMDQAAIRRRIEDLKTMERLDAAWAKIKATMIRAILPAVETLAELIDGLSPVIDMVIFGFKVLGGVIQGVTKVVKFLLTPVQMLLDGIKSIIDSFKGVEKQGKNVQASILGIGMDATSVGQAIGIVWGSAFGIKKIMKWGKALKTAMGGVADVAKDKAISKSTTIMETVTESVAGKAGGNRNIFGKIKDKILPKMKPTIAKAATKAPMETLTDKAIPKGKDVFKSVGDNVKDGLKSTGNLIKSTLKGFGDLIRSGFDFVKEILGKITDIVGTVFRDVAKIVKTASKDVLSVLTTWVDGLLSIGNKIVSEVSKISGKIIDGASQLFSKFLNLIKTNVDKLGNVGSSLINVVSKLLGNVIKLIKTNVGNLADVGSALLDAGTKLFTKLIKLIKTSAGQVVDATSQLLTKLTSFIKIGAGQLIDAASQLLTKLTSFIKIGAGDIARAGMAMLDAVSKLIGGVVNLIGSGVSSIIKAAGGIVDELSGLISKVQTGIFKIADGIISWLTTASKKVVGILKNVIVGIVDIVATAIQTIGTGVGQTIKAVLGGIGEGLAKFSPKAMVGAAAMLVLSSALWISSKAFQNFADIEWDDLAKGGAALVGLAGVAMVLGGSAPQMLIGAAAIALLGASLLPAAFAIEKFNAVEWSALAKAGVALVGLGAAGALLSGLAPMMLIGAVGIAAMGAALIPAAYAFGLFNDVDWGTLAKAGVALVGLAAVSPLLAAAAPTMIMGAAGVAVLGAALIPFVGAMKLMEGIDFENVGEGVKVMVGSAAALGGIAVAIGLAAPALGIGAAAIVAFGLAVIPASLAMAPFADKAGSVSDSLQKLQTISGDKLMKVAFGITAVASSVAAMGAGSLIKNVSNMFGGDPFKKLERLAEIADPLHVATTAIVILGESLHKLSQTLENIDLGKLKDLEGIKSIASKVGVGFKIRPVRDVDSVAPPKPESLGQHVSIQEPDSGDPATDALDPIQQAIKERMGTGSGQNVERLLTEMIRLLSAMNNRPLVFQFDDGTVRHLRNKTKALDNNI